MSVIFFNIGWMEKYQGQTRHDKLSGGHMHLRLGKPGHEQFNFLPHNGFVYGYAPVAWNEDKGEFKQIVIEKIGATHNSDSINNVTAIFIAKSIFNKTTYIVGWYKNATVYRYPQTLNILERRIDRDWPPSYICKTNITDAYCVPVSERVFIIPTSRGGETGYGQSTIWYAQKRQDVIERAMRYIEEGEMPPAERRVRQQGAVAQETKKRIEINAVKATMKHYRKFGFQVDDVSSDNCGWDLTVYNDSEEYFIEVKGTQTDNINFQLTPNEYAHLKKYREKYKISAATNCLDNITLDIFSIYYDSKKKSYWGINDQGTTLKLEEKTGAVGSIIY